MHVTVVSCCSVALLVAAAVLPVCGGSSTSGSGSSGSGAVPGTGGVLDGAALVDAKCTTCHPRSRIDQATKDLAGWQTTINRMVSAHGAKITTDEQSAIAIYLANR